MFLEAPARLGIVSDLPRSAPSSSWPRRAEQPAAATLETWNPEPEIPRYRTDRQTETDTPSYSGPPRHRSQPSPVRLHAGHSFNQPTAAPATRIFESVSPLNQSIYPHPCALFGGWSRSKKGQARLAASSSSRTILFLARFFLAHCPDARMCLSASASAPVPVPVKTTAA